MVDLKQALQEASLCQGCGAYIGMIGYCPLCEPDKDKGIDPLQTVECPECGRSLARAAIGFHMELVHKELEQ